MKGTVQRMSNAEGRTPPTSHTDDYFPQLCALAVTGALKTDEWETLEQHLLHCEECRRLIAEYQAVAVTALPRMAAERHFEAAVTSILRPWSIESAEASLFARIERENITPEPPSPQHKTITRAKPWMSSVLHRKSSIWRAAVTVLGFGMGLLAYYALTFHGNHWIAVSKTTPAPPLPIPASTQTSRPSASIAPTPLPASEKSTDALLAELRRKLHESQTLAEALTRQQQLLHDQLAERDTALALSSQERAALEQQLVASKQDQQALAGELAQARIVPPPTPAPTADLEAQLTALKAEVQDKDEELDRRAVLLEHDRDIRDLMGARDLYIGEIYDVAKSGKTQTPTGRVFYTRGKSLVFYAYDLDKGPGAKLTSTFQAWGRRGIDEHRNINLGIFYQDETNKQRWILKSQDPTTLSQIDAVFVTIEPHGESAKPTGKPLLFTYLRLSPNHP